MNPPSNVTVRFVQLPESLPTLTPMLAGALARIIAEAARAHDLLPVRDSDDSEPIASRAL